jgi:hypothetical protein
MEPLIVTKKRSLDLERIVAISPATIREISTTLKNKGFTGSHRSVSKVFRDLLSEEQSTALFNHAMSLTMHADDEQEANAVLLQRLRLGLKKFGWTEAQLQSYDSVLPDIQHLLDLEEFYLAVKSWTVLNLGVNHLHKLKIFTELKPLFSKDRQSILATVVKSDLVLVTSSSTENERETVVSLSISDLRKLKNEIENAICKVNAMRDFAIKSGDAPAVVYGDEA